MGFRHRFRAFPVALTRRRSRGNVDGPSSAQQPAPSLAVKIEYDQSAHPFRQDLIHGAIRMEQGRVRIPDGPGLGVDIDRGVIDRYKQNSEDPKHAV